MLLLHYFDVKILKFARLSQEESTGFYLTYFDHII